MAIKVYNTLTRKKEVFKPINKGKVNMYSCGPTVYNYAHIGNLRSFIFADILKKYLKFKGLKVKHVMNITDVDDKTIRDSREEGKTLKEFTEFYTKEFFKDFKTLNIEKPDIIPKATETIPSMVKLVKSLLNKKIAYKGKDGSVYYDISKFKNYGKLAHVKITELKVGERVKQDEYDKASATDFALWKAHDKEDGDVFWKTDIGKGRPGWHIECSAMSMDNLGETFDIHTGGVDLIFPHHENEIAQSEAATGKKFVKYWIHGEHLVVDGKKMSKSLGNFYTLRDILDKGYDPRAIRYELMATHYKQKLNFTLKGLEGSKISVERLQEFVNKLDSVDGKENKDVEKLIETAKKNFEKSMDDNLNISEALASIFDFTKEINKLIASEKMNKKNASSVKKFMQSIDSVLGVLSFEKQGVPKDIMNLVKKREEARNKKDWAASDKIRDELKEKGFYVDDTPKGAIVKRL
ncbi:MAG: cysteine--tRNA ligase [archaeon]